MRWPGKISAAGEGEGTLWLLAVFLDRLSRLAALRLEGETAGTRKDWQPVCQALLASAASLLRTPDLALTIGAWMHDLAAEEPGARPEARALLQWLVRHAGSAPSGKGRNSLPGGLETELRQLEAALPELHTLSVPGTEALVDAYLKALLRVAIQSRAGAEQQRWRARLNDHLPQFSAVVDELCADPEHQPRLLLSLQRLFTSPDEPARQAMGRELTVLRQRFQARLIREKTEPAAVREIQRIFDAMAAASASASFELPEPLAPRPPRADTVGTNKAGTPPGTAAPLAARESEGGDQDSLAALEECRGLILSRTQELASARRGETEALAAADHWRKQYEQHRRDLELLERQVLELQERAARSIRLQEQLENAQYELHEAQSAAKALRQAGSSGRPEPEDLSGLRQERDQARQEVRARSRQLQEVRAERDRARAELRRLQAAAAQPEPRDETAGAAAEQALPLLRKQLASLTEENARLRQREAELSRQEAELRRQREHADRLTAELETLRNEQVPALQQALEAARSEAARISGLERELGDRATDLAAARTALSRREAEIAERDRVLPELREVLFLAQQALLGVDEIKTRHQQDLVTDKSAPLLSHCLAQLAWAIVSHNRTLRTAMLLNLRTIATAFRNVPHFPILLAAVERLEPQLTDLEAALPRSEQLGDGHYFFQRALQAVYSQGVNLLPFRYGVDADGKVLQID